MDTLLPHTRETHRALAARLDQAERAHSMRDPHEGYPAVDTFLTMAARHTAASHAVLVPAARRKLDHGQEMARELVEESRRFELTLNQVKAKLYGSPYAQRRSWRSLWSDVRREFEYVSRMEERVAGELAASRVDEDPDWSAMLYRVELHGPARPLPWIPNRGVHGHLARTLAARVDGWAEGWWATEPRTLAPDPDEEPQPSEEQASPRHNGRRKRRR
ncbi:hypothetical protein [Nocardioides campestrisoli]|uniref:hypothetical protein n=1 Tax=Nocardioides campestrisoli TaxID=2736757 RepID=UPI0015E6D059|nr:hypothetical protein [Nocardioides campestrisoli]